MCVICVRLKNNITNENFFIHEFKHSYFVVGSHQYFEGYSQLIYKNHIEDLTDLDSEIQSELLSEVMIAAKAVKHAYSAVRINYSCIGNIATHVHFHLFPRFKMSLL